MGRSRLATNSGVASGRPVLSERRSGLHRPRRQLREAADAFEHRLYNDETIVVARRGRSTAASPRRAQPGARTGLSDTVRTAVMNCAPSIGADAKRFCW
jgi:hypothetical protein